MLVFACLGTACVSTPSITRDTDAWQMRGRVGIKMPNEALSFSVNWYQEPQSFDIRLSSTLGISVAHVYGDETSVAIDVPGKGKFQAESASELLERYTGLILPIESLRYWVRGNPAPGVQFQRNGTLLRQSGWEINYLDFEGENPRHMRITKADIKVTLVVSSWQT